ncbi:alanine racemase [Desulfovibrio inopinatus]|uniref:alanine racemase n=1 Tax=Desulfovibrio inopinatus TaxID=102109 RepID=UPI0004272153|nr:alanine racemase [Desulfovibrio inopinatus]
MTKMYVKPAIEKLSAGFMNTYGLMADTAIAVRRDIDGVSIDDLCQQFGSPLFVYSENRLRHAIRNMKNTFANHYPNVVTAWSYKTNYLQGICGVFHEEGALAEVVSAMEYDRARALGIPGENIIFNGPVKPLDALERAAKDGALIHIDHMDEIDDLESVAQAHNLTIKVGIRINLDAGIYPQWSRFGFNLESDQALEAVRRIHVGGRLQLSSLHCHIGTYILDPAAYGRQTEKMVRFAKHIESTFGFLIETIDIGGGFPSSARLKNSYLPPDVSVPAMDEYASAISTSLLEGFPAGRFPRLVLEAGRALVDDAGFLITTIAASRRLMDGSRAYVVDAGLHVLFTSFWYKHGLEIDRPITGITEKSAIYGSLCMNIDVLEESVMLPPLPRGARFIMSPVGAYNQTQSMQFIHYRPAAVMITQAGEPKLICRKETLEDHLIREAL